MAGMSDNVSKFQSGNDRSQQACSASKNSLLISEERGEAQTDDIGRQFASKKPDEAYYFENALELAIYGELKARDRAVGDVGWLPGDQYQKEFEKAYLLFEKRDYYEALKVLQNCLVLNPIGLRARFEICETYIQLHDFWSARRTLLDMKDYIVKDCDQARFYRRMGFIETERHNYRAAAACYQYSLKYENHPLAYQELRYIQDISGIKPTASGLEKTLIQARIPILVPLKFNWLKSKTYYPQVNQM